MNAFLENEVFPEAGRPGVEHRKAWTSSLAPSIHYLNERLEVGVSATFKVMMNAVWRGGNQGISSQVLSRPWLVMEEKPQRGAIEPCSVETLSSGSERQAHFQSEPSSGPWSGLL